MKQLTCEMCGSTDLVKQDGVFVCQTCGCKYSVEEAKKMMVEGIVEVQGTVKVDASNQVDSLLKRANFALSDRIFETAEECAEQILRLDPECCDAYLIKLLCSYEINELKTIIGFPFEENPIFKRVLQYANEDLKKTIEILKKEREMLERQRLRAKKISQRISTHSTYCVAVQANGTVVGEGEFPTPEDYDDEVYPDYKQKIAQWRDVVAISGGDPVIVGLTSKGRILKVGCEYSESDKKNPYFNANWMNEIHWWSNIVMLESTYNCVAALTADGRVRYTNLRKEDIENCLKNIENWRDIVDISFSGAGGVVALKKDGTVCISNDNEYYGQSDFETWENIIAISASSYHCVGLKADGTVVAVGSDSEGECNVSDWCDIIAVATGSGYTVGLKTDGTVVAVGFNKNGEYSNVESWRDIVAIACDWGTIGVKKDGSVVVSKRFNRTKISNWKLFNSIETFEEEIQEEPKKLQLQEKEEKKIRQAKEAEERRIRQAKEAEERHIRQAKEAEERRIRQAKEAEERRIRQEQESKMQKYRIAGVCQHCGGKFKGFFTKTCSSCGKQKDY